MICSVSPPPSALISARIDIGDDDLCPFPGEELRRRTADGRASAGNKRRLALRHSFRSPRLGVHDPGRDHPLARALAAYKVPRAIQFVDDVPKTSTGKLMRRELRTLDA